MKNDTPNTSEIIEELKSISAYLSQDQDDLIPVLTEKALSSSNDSDEILSSSSESPTEINTADERPSGDTARGVSPTTTKSDATPEEQTQPPEEQLDEADIVAAYQAELEYDFKHTDSSKQTDTPPANNNLQVEQKNPSARAETPQKPNSLFETTSEQLEDKPEETKAHLEHADGRVSSTQTRENKESTKKRKLKPSPKLKKPKVNLENPFLPPHIRNKLGNTDIPKPKHELWPKGKIPENFASKNRVSAPQTGETQQPEGKRPEVQGDLLAGTEHQEQKVLDQKTLQDLTASVIKEITPMVQQKILEHYARIKDGDMNK